MPSIVIIDDSESVLDFVEALLERNLTGCQVRKFSDARQALTWCHTNEVELILVDYHMPGLDGLAFIEAYRSDPAGADVPLVMVTGDELNDTRYAALQLGATDFLRKPIDEIEFVPRIRNLLALSRSCRSLADQAKLLAAEVRKATNALVEREREAILVLSRAAEHRDPETGRHLVRMAAYSRLIGIGLGLSGNELDLLHAAAPLHDVGKIGIPDGILLKPGRLTSGEFAVMRQHPIYGYEILGGSTSPLLQMAAEIALYHHEKFDGTGYPNSVSGENIPLVGRIVALADVFDALTSNRPYKLAWSVEAALDYIEAERGKHFDPACVDSLLSVLDEVRDIAGKTAYAMTAAPRAPNHLIHFERPPLGHGGGA